jgi:F-type H+-transporting ATPase subunit delta
VTRAKILFDQVGSAYANALVSLAQEKNVLEAVHADIDALQSLFKDNDAVKDFLFNPTTPEQKRKDLLSSVAKEAGLTEWTLNFLNLLVQQGRIEAVEEIFTAFEDQYCKLTDTQVATLRSAVKLEQEQQFLIAKKLQELTGSKNIKLKPVIDDSLIAGFVVEYGSSQIDLSVKGQLDKISAELQGVAA